MESDTVPTLMGILAIYCGFVKKGFFRGTEGKMPLDQQRAIDDFARVNGCEIYWSEKHKCHLWSVKDV